MDSEADARIEAARREFKRLRSECGTSLSWNERFERVCESQGLSEVERQELLRRLG